MLTSGRVSTENREQRRFPSAGAAPFLVKDLYNGFVGIARLARSGLHQRLGLQIVEVRHSEGSEKIVFLADVSRLPIAADTQMARLKLPCILAIIVPVAILAGTPSYSRRCLSVNLCHFPFTSAAVWLSFNNFLSGDAVVLLALLIVASIAEYSCFLSLEHVHVTSDNPPSIAMQTLREALFAARQNGTQFQRAQLIHCGSHAQKYLLRQQFSLHNRSPRCKQDRGIASLSRSSAITEQAGIQMLALVGQDRASGAFAMSRRGIMAAYVRSFRALVSGRNSIVEWSKRAMPLYRTVVKPGVERISAFIVLVLILPLLAAISMAIAIDSPGPILFRQIRRGYEGKLFTIFKFRTMFHYQSQTEGHQTWKDDQRVTYLGRYLRRMSLDELPQLVNVVLGEMSLVGPRPLAEDLHRSETPILMGTPAYERRYHVRPGITGWAQIHGLRGAIRTDDELRKRIEFDNHYVENASAALDLKILLCTPHAVIKAENAF